MTLNGFRVRGLGFVDDGLPKSENNQDIRQREKEFCCTVEPINVSELLSIRDLRVNACWNCDNDKYKEHVEANQGKSGRFARASEEPEESEIREEGEGEEGFFGHGKRMRDEGCFMATLTQGGVKLAFF
jgi:hypothetical protein